ncbi:DUF1491 family protein [Novosphingobium sp. 9]|uniref:DUF1491 family protein n=1 Tax=Novosphingobium sp. 9 TaxID=2025349 RepID=UPI0021B65EA7|nr:DUF1491 family protein [Novosphingobium sp. 9]
MDQRLPAHLEVAALIRRTQAAGGFAMVLAKGEADAGTILVTIQERGGLARLYERMPRLDGTRGWDCSRVQDAENPFEFTEYLDRRKAQDRDLWIVELDVAGGERLLVEG